ncbi:phage tail fiber domain-containing protein [Citrobacter koseri]|uniref:phage tail fiber domain-containing protein n=1 Tax=Citrobacter koseri TaxID=545 RepID=UPI001EEDD724|nr:phage tail fiber protein [Citrobacter koseri]
MSVPNQTPYIIYNANGLTTVFPFEFYVITASDIQVTFDGVEVTTGYSVTGVGNVSGGDVVFITPPVAGTVVMIERVVPTYRLTDYQDNGDLLADTVNKDFDRLWMAIQRSFIYLGLALRRPLLGGPFNAEGYRIEKLADPVNPQDAATKKWVEQTGQSNFNRTLRVPESYIPPLVSAERRANKMPAFDSAGNIIYVVPPSGSASDILIELAKHDSPVSIAGITASSVANNVRATGVPVEEYGIKAGEVVDVTKLMTAFDSAEHLIFMNGDYIIPDFLMPSTAKCIKITVRDSRLIMDGYSHVYNTTDTFTIDLSDNGVYHGGLRRATVTTDCAVGSYDIPVDDASVFNVGDFVTTSFLVPEPFDESSTPWNWANKIYNPNCHFNTIEAINGNVLTVKYPVESRTLMKNVIIGNWQFSQNGIGFRGTGKVFIKGGKITEPKTRMLSIHNSVACYIDGTELTYMSVDAIELAHNASLYLDNFRFWGSLDFGKQGITYTSSGTISMKNGYWRRGNFDVDIYPGAPSGGATQLGDVILENMTFVGTSTLPLTGDQVDSVTGQTANQLFQNRINPSRTVYSINPGAYVAPATGTSLSFIAKNCEFLNYQRAVLKTEFSNNGDIRLRNMVFRDVTATCALFDVSVQPGYAVAMASHELHNLKVERRYTIQYNPVCYIALDTLLIVTGGLDYNDGAISGVDHRVSTNFLYIDVMTIRGGGTPILDQPMFVDRLIVRGSHVTVRPGTQRNTATQLLTIAGGVVDGPLVTKQASLQTLTATDYSFVASSGSWVSIGSSSNAFPYVDVRIQLGPRQELANSNCIMGTISARLAKDSTSVPVNYTSIDYVSLAAGNMAYWEGCAVGSQGAIADGSVHLRCLPNGTIQLNINTTAGTSGVAWVTSN